jgi:hypothetical protein
VLGYVPIHVVNLSLEELELAKQTEVGIASPIQIDKSQRSVECGVNAVCERVDVELGNFDKYLQEKLAHLGEKERHVLEPVLRQYKRLFYGIGSM